MVKTVCMCVHVICSKSDYLKLAMHLLHNREWKVILSNLKEEISGNWKSRMSVRNPVRVFLHWGAECSWAAIGSCLISCACAFASAGAPRKAS